MIEEATHLTVGTHADFMILYSWLRFGRKSKIMTDDLGPEEAGYA